MGQMTWGEYAKEVEKTGGFSLLPIGPHNIRVDTTEVKPGKAGSNQILARFVVTDGPSMGGSILNNMAPFKNNGDPNGFFLQGIAALGLGRAENAEFWAQLDAMDVDDSLQVLADSMIGREATITVDHGPFGGTMRDNVKKMAPKGAAIPGTNVPGAPGTVVNIAPGMPVPVAAPAAAVPAAAPPAVVPVAAPAAAVPQVAAVPSMPSTNAGVVVPQVLAAPPVVPPAAAPAIVAPPVAATQQPVPETAPAAAAPAAAVVPPAVVAAPAVAENPVAVPAPQAPPVVPPAAQELIRPDEAPF